MPSFLLLSIAVVLQIPQWENSLGHPPISSPLLAENSTGGMDIFITLGDNGLSGFNGFGEILDGFPLSVEEGVSRRPAALYSPSLGHVIVYADNRNELHMVDHSGREMPGWPRSTSSSIITGISVVDLDEDGNGEIAFGTDDAMIHMWDLGGNPIPGWPVEMPGKLQWQPVQLSLGGGSGYGLVCALVTTKVFVLSRDGSILPGWPINVGYSSGSIPVTADINGDGLGNVVFAAHNQRLYSVTTSGNRVEEWPFFLDERCVPGPLAIGRVDTGFSRLQVAVSCVDSTVILLDSDGSLAGTWRWPNATNGRPTTPVIVDTDGGLGVIVATDAGTIYCWDANGSEMDGFPIDFNDPVSSTPAAGDIDNDGNLELIVVGRTGKIAAYEINSGSCDPGPWPQYLRDQSNTGFFGTSFLPVATAGEITGERSGTVVLPYSVQGGSSTGVSLAYSTNAGFSWLETSSYTDNGSSIQWFSDQDIPGDDIRECALKITPYHSDGPGISGISNVFHVDNNTPPVLQISTYLEESDGRYRLHYAVVDPEGDIIQLQAQYSADGQQTWNNARLSGSTMEIAPWFYGEPVIWNARNDAGDIDLENVALRVRAADSDPGPWSVMINPELDSMRLASGQIVAPDVEVSGRVSIGMRLVDEEDDPLALQYEYSADGETDWKLATVVESSVPYVGSYSYDIIWDSEADLPGFDGRNVRFRAVPEDPERSVTVPSSTFHLDNNYPPTVNITSPRNYKAFDGYVPITFQLSDPEGDEILLMLHYRFLGGTTWTRATGLDIRDSYSPASYNSTINWNCTEDLPGMEREELEIRLGAVNGDTVYSQTVGPLSIDNTRAPAVMQAAICEISSESRIITVWYELTDPEESTLDLQVSYSTNSGLSWEAASVEGDLFGRYGTDYQGRFNWNYGRDLGSTGGTVLLKITPVSGSIPGTPKVIETALR